MEVEVEGSVFRQKNEELHTRDKNKAPGYVGTGNEAPQQNQNKPPRETTTANPHEIGRVVERLENKNLIGTCRGRAVGEASQASHPTL